MCLFFKFKHVNCDCGCTVNTKRIITLWLNNQLPTYLSAETIRQRYILRLGFSFILRLGVYKNLPDYQITNVATAVCITLQRRIRKCAMLFKPES